MKKKLAVADLVVESFETNAGSSGLGTVRGFQETLDCENTRGWTCPQSCKPTCAFTCNEAECPTRDTYDCTGCVPSMQ